MKEFLNAALPWILVGVAIAITTVGYSKEQKKGTKRAEALAAAFYVFGLNFRRCHKQHKFVFM